MGAAEGLGVFENLAEAVGLTRDGDLQGQWFEDPLGNPNGSKRGLSSMMYTDDQRTALMTFVDDVLGPPDQETQKQAVWVPLFKDSGATIFVVVEQASDSARVGFGIEYESSGSTPSVSVRCHIPVFQFAREGSPQSRDVSGSQPDWLVLGRNDANIGLSLDINISNAAPVAGELYIGGVYLSIEIPTDSSDSFALGVGFRRLQLPGTSVPRDFDLTVDSLDELGPEFLEFMAGLLQAQADALEASNPATAPFAALTGMFGLRQVANIPAFPLEGLITQGTPALIKWLESIFTTTSSRDAWLGQLGNLIGGTVNSPRAAIEFSSGLITGAIGLRVSEATGGGVVITPWVECALRPQTGSEVLVSADLLTTDTSNGEITALPNLLAVAVFGRDAGLASDLLSGDPGLGSVRLGIKVTEGRPEFMLTAHDVTLGGASHAVLDLSSPDSVLNAASGAINSALVNALNDLGRPGELAAILFGLNPPAGVSALSPVELLIDPLAALRGYWQSLTANPTAFSQVLLALQELITGSTTAVAGAGTEIDPWVVDIGSLSVLVFVQGDHIHIDLSAEVAASVMSDHEAFIAVRARLARIDLLSPSVQFFSIFAAGIHLRRADRAAARFDLGPADLVSDSFGFELSWSALQGTQFGVSAPNLALQLEQSISDSSESVSLGIPLPEFSADGSISYTPNWGEVEQAVATLLGRIESPVVDTLLNLIGWTGRGARLRLDGLIADPGTELESWLADLVLDCSNVSSALTPLAYLTSGFRASSPLGSGNENDPYRLPIANEPRAPGIAAWLKPGCPLPADRYEPPPGYFDRSEPPEEGVLVSALHDAARSLPELRDLLVGRNSLEQGLQQLSDRFAGTDGLLGQPAVLPTGVNGADVEGYSYRELVALGATNTILIEVLDPVPTAVLYVGCETVWSQVFTGNSFDARTVASSSRIAGSGDGNWSLAVPDPEAAASARPDRGSVGEQAERIKQFLTGRSDPVTVVAYGAAGAAAIKAAETTPVVERVVTVGTPWSPLAVSGLTSGLSGDALRMLEQIRRPVDEELSEELLAGESSPLLQIAYLVDRAVATAGFTDARLGELPPASDQSLRPGLNVDAVFGLLDSDTVDFGLAALIADAIEYLYELRQQQEFGEPESLHLGVDLPVIDTDLGGILFGAGATLELVSCDRGATGDGFAVHNRQQLILDLHLGVTDGWLIGGPGAAQQDIEARWMEARLYLPMSGSTTISEARFTFHEASCFGVQRERWVVEKNADGLAATLPTPEVHLLMDQVVTRLSAASSDMTQLLVDIGLVRTGGYDPQGLDRLIYDTDQVINDALTQSASSLVNVLRSLGGFGGSGSELSWNIDVAHISIDLLGRSLQLDFTHAAGDLVEIAASVEIDSAGLEVSTSIGGIDDQQGGLQLRADINSAALAERSLGINWRLPGAAHTSIIDLLSLTDLSDLIKLAASLVPASLAGGFINMLRDRADETARAAIEDLLEGLNLLGPVPEYGSRRVLLPWALFIDPMAWLNHATSAWSSDPFGQAVTTADAVVQLVVPGHSGGGLPVCSDVLFTYGVDSGRLQLGVDVDINHSLAGSAMQVSIAGGLVIATNGSVAPQLATGISFDGVGLELAVSPALSIDLLRPAPTAPLSIYPAGPGIGSLISAGAGMAIPLVLNALIAERNNASASIQREVGLAIFEIGGALDLLSSDSFDDAKITSFAADPGAALLTNLPNLIATAIAQLASAIDPAGTVVSSSSVSAGITRLQFGSILPLNLIFDSSMAGPAIELSGEFSISDVGTFRADRIRISSSGLQLAASYTGASFDVGNGLQLIPVAKIQAGVSGVGFDRLMAIGLATDGAGDQSVEFRWALDTSPPRVVVVNRSVSGETEDSDVETVALALLSQAISMAAGITLEALDPLGTRVVNSLQNVIFSGGSAVLDPQLFNDFSDPEALLKRLYQLAFNLADDDLKITIDGKVEIGFTRNGNLAGVLLSLAEGERIGLVTSDPTVDLEVVGHWVRSDVARGLSVYLIEKNGDNFDLNAGFAIAGLGVRVGKNAGPLLNLGIMSVDAIGVHVYGEAVPAGLGGGVHVQLDGLAIVPSAAGGDNAVANNLMSDAGNDASPSARPAFSPSLAVQKAPGQDLGISLRAGEPPGPWWLVIQRQLGPLYLEQFGFNTTEINGTVTGVSLLFDASVSLFGLTAEVDQLGLHWLGGDFFELNNWAVDLQGLGVSGDFSGLSISGGLLKTNMDGNIGYVGMLMGRFGVYGLSLFGGYNDDKGLPSFFVFGAIQGPIGGPPAFFLTGIGGGLGIKRGLRVPDDLSKFGEYPFIKALDPSAPVSSNPLDELRKLAEYFPPEPGNFWFAAGISFTSFSLVDGVAVLSVSIGDGLDLNLFGLARLALPRPQAALVSIELGLLARFSSSEGLFLIQAQLTDNSWLLYPEVRLTGGFAFATWWKGPNAGQFVLTLGGYHPSFFREGYPVVPRLGLEWRFSNAIVIKGGSYFALTSEALMAGVEIEVSADFGFAWARISFGANAIVYFDPFYFMADAYARIAAGIKIKTFFGTIRISISIGARIEVEGPKFHGRATIEVGPCDIKVKFGKTSSIRGVFIGWDDFVSKYLEESNPGRARALSGISGKGSLPAATEGDTSAPSCDGSISRPFEVFAEFELSVVSTVPATHFDFGHATVNRSISPKLPSGNVTTMGLSPMNASNLSSRLSIRLQKKTDGAWQDRTVDLLPLVNGMQEEGGGHEGPSFALEAFPIGVWGLPEDENQPSSPLPKGDVIFAGSRLKLVAAADMIGQAGPQIDYYRVEAGRKPLPLSATGNRRASMLERSNLIELANLADSVDQAFFHAEQFLFGDVIVGVEGLIDVGKRSDTAQASYVRSRTAPPLFGTLMDGLDSDNGGNATSEAMAPVAGVQARTPRAPFVTGLMTSGAGVSQRLRDTTVSNKRIKRRSAPSIDSVKGRLGRSLPIKLNLTAAPGKLDDETLIVRGTVPRTDVAGVGRSYLGGHVGAAIATGLVKGLGGQSSTLAPESRLRAGDVVSMRFPDARIDAGEQRPELRIEGDARVVMLGGNGAVVKDQLVHDNVVTVPPHTALMAIQANGTDLGQLDQEVSSIAGWHDQSRIVRLAGRSALAAGCVIHMDGADGRSRLGWGLGGDMLREAVSVSTRFSKAVSCVGVILKGGEARYTRDFDIQLYGATHVTDVEGDVSPVVIQDGNRSILMFEVKPDSSSSAVSLRVTQGGSYQVSGVIGSKVGLDQVVDWIAERGLVAMVARLRATTGNGCAIEWLPVQDVTT